MPKMIRITNMHDHPRGRLEARAARAGMPLSDHLLNETRRAAERPTFDVLRARLDRRPAVTPAVPPARAVHAERDGR